MISTSGICLFCFCLSLMVVSPLRMPTFHFIPNSAITSSIARPISFASALNGVIQISCKPFFFLFDNFLDDRLMKSISAPENRKCFATACGAFTKTAFTINDMLPALFLKQKRLEAFCRKPLLDYFISCCRLKFQCMLIKMTLGI